MSPVSARALVDAFGLTRYQLIGNSIGAYIGAARWSKIHTSIGWCRGI